LNTRGLRAGSAGNAVQTCQQSQAVFAAGSCYNSSVSVQRSSIRLLAYSSRFHGGRSYSGQEADSIEFFPYLGAFLDSTGIDRARVAGSRAAAASTTRKPNLNGKQQQPSLALAA